MTQRELLPVEHRAWRGTCAARLKKFREVNPERVYVAYWMRQNRSSQVLHHILDGQVSRRDAEVAARVVQWLGTNCGMGLVLECERRIESARGREDARAYVKHRPTVREQLEERRKARAEAFARETAAPSRRGVRLAGRI